MSKIQILLRIDERTMEPADFERRVRHHIVPRLLRFEPEQLQVTWTAEVPPSVTFFPFERNRCALFSIWQRPGDETSAAELKGALDAPPEASCAGYLVESATPVAYDRAWPDGEVTPGTGILTLFRKRPDLDDAEFIERWHGGHTPLSLRIHPLWSYVRNRVLKPWIEGSPPLDGIVEEFCRNRSDLLNPARFFGGWTVMPLNMAKVAIDIRRFIDLSSMEVYLVRELHVRTAHRTRSNSV